MTFRQELEHLINKHSMENESNTPDWILAHFLSDCLNTFNCAVNERIKWHGGNEPIRHGINCPKTPHGPKGYLHGEDDDTPFTDNGLAYCGRCHAWMGWEAMK